MNARIVTLGGFSAHAGQSTLLRWLQQFRPLPSRIFLVHGEEAAAATLASRIERETSARANIPTHGESVEL